MSALVEDEGPDENDQDDPLLVEWAAELAVRIQNGETVDWDALANRHPERAEVLHRMLPAFALMARLGDPMHREAARRDAFSDPMAELGCLGDYRLLREVGRGGMGVVYEAHQISLKRRVALKVLPFASAMDARQLQRFQIEAQAAAALHHTNIVPVFAVGTERDVPFYAMQFIDGRSLAEVIRELRQLDGAEAAGPAAACALTRSLIAGHFAPTPKGEESADCQGSAPKTTSSEPAGPTPVSAGSSARCRGFIRTVAALGLQAAQALEHAHERGILHRDIKPSNLLVDQAGHLWVTDFGLARVPGETNLTLTGDVLGTLRYMSPEQALGKRVMVDGRSDVYSLGVTLYELGTLHPAFGGDDRQEVLRRIAQEEPRPPRRLNPAIPAPFETIVLKAMAKEPARRYASAAALRDDLQRFLDSRPILGRPVSHWERARSWTRRRPAVAALIGVIVLMACALVGGIAAWISWLGYHNRQLEIQVARADEQSREATKHAGIAENRRLLADRHHYAESLRLARRSLDARQIELAQDVLHDIQPEPDGHDPRGFAWRYLWRQAHREFSQLWGHEANVLGGAVAPDGDSLATADMGGTVRIWDLRGCVYPGRSKVFRSARYAEPNVIQFSKDGRYLAIGLVSAPAPLQGIEIFDVTTCRCLAQLVVNTGHGVSACAFDDQRRLFEAVVHGAGSCCLKVVDLGNPSVEPRTRRLRDDVATTELSPDGRLLAVRRKGQAELEDPLTGKVLTVLDGAIKSGPHYSRFSADRRFFTGVADGELLVWETDNGSRIAQAPIKHSCMAIEPGSRGRYVAWMEDHGRVSVLEPATGRVREFIPGSDLRRLGVGQLSISSDEALLAIRQRWHPGGPEPAEVWNLASGHRVAEFPGRNEDGRIWFIPGRHDLLVANVTGPRIWRLDLPTAPDAVAGHASEAWAAAFAPDGNVLATGSDDTKERQTIKLWEKASGRLSAGWKAHTATVAALAFSPDGRVLASGSLDSGKPGNPNVILWDAASHQRLAILEGHTGWVRSVAFSPDGRLLATGSDDNTARLWDVAEQKTRAVLKGHNLRLNSIAFSPDGRLLATASHDDTVRLWDVATGRSEVTLPDVANVFAVAFSPDGSLLASVNEEGAIKLWDPASGERVRTIRAESEQLRCLAFTRDGRNVVAAGKGKVIRIWDVVTGQELLSLEGHKAQINALAFSPDGSILASCSHDGAVKLWRADWPGLEIAP